MIIDSSLDYQLNEWARWSQNTGWPKESPIFHLVNGYGNHTDFKTSYTLIPSNEIAERIEIAVKELSRKDEKCADALKAYYFCKHVPVREIAKAIGVPKSTFLDWVKSAKTWLSGKLC